MSEATPQQSAKNIFKKIALVLLLTAYLVTAATALGLYGLSVIYAERVYPGVTVAGVNLSGKTWEEAATEVESIISSLEKTVIPIEVQGGQTFHPTLTELGVEFDRDTVIGNLFSIGHGPNLWDGTIAALTSFLREQPIELVTSFNQKILERYVDETTAQLAKKAKNAALKVSNGVVEIDPSQIGEEADPEYLKSEITKRLTNLKVKSEKLTLSEVVLSIARAAPEITDAEASIIQKEAQAMIGEPISVEFEGKIYTFSPADIGSWITFKEVEVAGSSTYRPEFDDGKINGAIASKIARAIDIRMIPRKVLITTGQVIDEGREGRTLDKAGLLAGIRSLLESRTRSTLSAVAGAVPKVEQQVYPDFTLGLYEGRYIEINLTKQMLYAIEGNVLVNGFQISSGLEWGGYATPTGTLYIKNKVGFAYSNPYRLWMPYWNGLARNQDGSGYEGYGIHELPCFNRSCTWREGISHLGRPASHGCIRLGHNGQALFIYDWAPVGTPVYIHR